MAATDGVRYRDSDGGARWGAGIWYDLPIGGSAHELETAEAMLLELRQGLQYGDPAGARLVGELLDAIREGGRRAAHWATLDLFETFDTDALVEALGRRQRLRGAGMVEFLRNLLVLAPIVVTWAVVSFAVAAYQTDIHRNNAESAFPFLFLWQTRFRGQTLLTFNELALIDAGLVALLIFLTSVHRWMTIAAGQEGRARALVRHALTGATLLLADHRADRESVMRGLIDETARVQQALVVELELQKSITERTERERAALTAELGTVVTQLRQGSSEMREWSAHLKAVHEGVNGRFDQTVRRLDTMQTETRGAVDAHVAATAAARTAAANLGGSADRLDAATTNLGGTATQLAGVVDGLDGSAAVAAAAAQSAADAAARAGSVAQEAATAAADVRAAAREVTEAAGRFADRPSAYGSSAYGSSAYASSAPLSETRQPAANSSPPAPGPATYREWPDETMPQPDPAPYLPPYEPPAPFPTRHEPPAFWSEPQTPPPSRHRKGFWDRFRPGGRN